MQRWRTKILDWYFHKIDPRPYLLLALFALLLAGCTSAPVKVDVSHHIPIDCGPEPHVQKLVLKDVEPVAAYDPESGTAYVWFSIDDYEDLALNNARITSHFGNLSVIIRHYQKCIEDFNGQANDSPHPGDNS